MRLFSLLGILGCVLAEALLKSKNKLVTVNVLVPPEYAQMAGMNELMLLTYLKVIATTVEANFNTSEYARSNGYSVSLSLRMPVDNPMIKDVTVTTCESGIKNIASLLNEINVTDNLHHYIVLMPCHANKYKKVFDSANVPVPLLESRINVECAKRVAMFLEKGQVELMSSFGNALLRVLGADDGDYTAIIENEGGDDGVMDNLNMKDSTVYRILHNECFLNS